MKEVQYPFGCDVSQTSVPWSEQSVFVLHLAPTCGEQPVRRESAAPATAARRAGIAGCAARIEAKESHGLAAWTLALPGRPAQGT